MNRLPAILLIAALAPLAGCNAYRTNIYEPAEMTATPDPVLLNKIELDPSVRRVATVVGAVEQDEEGKPYLVQVRVRNTTGKPQRFLYQWEWIAPNGLAIQSAARDAWQQETIRGGEIVSLTATAPRPDVRDFRLKITEPVK